MNICSQALPPLTIWAWADQAPNKVFYIPAGSCVLYNITTPHSTQHALHIWQSGEMCMTLGFEVELSINAMYIK